MLQINRSKQVARLVALLFVAIIGAGVLAGHAYAATPGPTDSDKPAASATVKEKPQHVPTRPNASVLCVSTGGGATGAPCANDPAYTSVQTAVNAAASGDEIRIAGGQYPNPGTANVTVNKNLFLSGGYDGSVNGWGISNDSLSTVLSGQVIVQGAATTLTIDNLQIVFGGISNAGTVKVDSGFTLNVAQGGGINGAYNLATGSVLAFISGNHTIANGAQFSGGGLLAINNSNVILNGNVSARNLRLIAGTLSGDAPGVLTIPSGGVFDWWNGAHSGSGTTTIAAGATLNIAGVAAPHQLIQRTLNNNGTINMNGTGSGYFSLGSGAALNNGAAPGSAAQFNIFNDDSVIDGGGTGSVITNYGTISKKAGINTPSIFGNNFIVLNNQGAIKVESGTLSLDSYSTDLGASTYSASLGATLRFNGNSHSIGPNSVVNVAGIIEFLSGSANIAGAFNVTGTAKMTGGSVIFNAPANIGNLTIQDPTVFSVDGTVNVNTLSWSSGVIKSTSGGVMNIATSVTFLGVQTAKYLDGATINNNGVANMNTTGLGSFVLQNGAVFNNNNHAQFNINNNDSIVYGGGALPTFNNVAGATFRKKAGAGLIASSLGTSFMQFNNDGYVEVLTGTLSLDGGGSPGDENTHTGSFKVDLGATLRFGYGNGASVNNLLSTAHVTGQGSVEVQAGIMTTAGEYNITGSTNLTGGTLNFDADLSKTGSVYLAAGAISGSGILNVAGNFNWVGGTMTSEPGLRARTDLGANGTLHLAGVNSNKFLIRRIFNNFGTAYMDTTGVGGFYLGDNAQFNNNNIFNITNNDSVYYSDGAQSAFNNFKTLRKTGGAGISTLGSGNLTFNNVRAGAVVGSVEVVTGTLSLDGGGIDTGMFLVDVTVGAARLRFNGGIHTLQTGSSVTGPGDVEFSLGTANFAGVYNVTGETRITGGTANFNHDVNAKAKVLSLRSGTLAGDGALTVTDLLDWTGGTMDGAGSDLSTTNVAAAATLNIRGVNSSKALSARTLNNNGAAFMNGTGAGVLVMGNGATFNNAGSFDIQNDDSIVYSGGTLSHIRNSGTLTKSVGAGITTLGNGQVDFNNTGHVTVVTGTISLDGGGISTGAFLVEVNVGAARLRFNGGTHTLQSGSSVTGPGDVEFSAGTANFAGVYKVTGKTLLSGGTVGFNQGVNAVAYDVNFTAGTLTGNGTFNLAPHGTMNWNGGTMDGAGAITSTTNISTGATLNLGGVGTGKALLARTVNNYGRVVMNGTGSGILSMGNGSYFNNTATGSFAIQNDDSVVFGGGTASVFNNFGTFQKAAGGGVSIVGTDNLAFNNNGKVQVNTGVVNFARNFVQGEDGTTLLNGGDLTTATVLEFAGGSLTGRGAITGTVSNSGGTIAPSGTTDTGSQIGLITINGNYAQGGDGAIRLQFSGPTAGSGYDKVRVLGNATLSGTLALSTLNYSPPVGTSFTPLTYNDRQNTSFGTISGLNLGSGRSFQVSYNPSDLTLLVVSGAATATPTFTPTQGATPTGTPPTATPTNTPGGPCTVTFGDVTHNNTFYTFIMDLACHGVISGYQDGTFRPGNPTTRGQLSKIVVNAMGWSLANPATPHFTDVTQRNAFYQFIETAYAHSIIAGYADGSFKWGNNVTRGQLSKIVVGALGWVVNCPQTSTFDDVSSANPFYCQIETAYAHHIISGYSNGASGLDFRPGADATRGQISKIVDLAITEP